jgi:hypothetical protein
MEVPFRYGRKLRIYRISGRGQPTRGCPPALGLGVRLTTPHRKNNSVTEMNTKLGQLLLARLNELLFAVAHIVHLLLTRIS